MVNYVNNFLFQSDHNLVFVVNYVWFWIVNKVKHILFTGYHRMIHRIFTDCGTTWFCTIRTQMDRLLQLALDGVSALFEVF